MGKEKRKGFVFLFYFKSSAIQYGVEEIGGGAKDPNSYKDVLHI